MAFNFLKVFLFLTFMNHLHAENRSVFYKVKRGDQLGKILSSLKMCPLWGASNSVTRTIALNPEVVKEGILEKNSIIKIVLPDNLEVVPAIINNFLVIDKFKDNCASSRIHLRKNNSVKKKRVSRVKKQVKLEKKFNINNPKKEESISEKSSREESIVTRSILDENSEFFISARIKTGQKKTTSTKLSNNSKARFASNMLLGLNIQVDHAVSKDYSLSFTNEVYYLDYPGSSSVPTKQASKVFYSNALNLLYNYSKLIQIGAGVGAGQAAVLVPAVESVSIHRALLPYLNLLTNIKLPTSKKTSMFSKMSASYYGPSEQNEFKVKNGARFNASLGIKRIFQSFSFETALGGEYLQLKTSVTKQLDLSLYSYFNFCWKI